MANKNDRKEPCNGETDVFELPRMVCVEIDKVQLYDHNPRKTRNPEYERIKQSIMSHGLEQPLVVARRPGQSTYTVSAGGNTRLQILKELSVSSHDPSYSMVNCVEVGWKDEATVLLGHLRENNLRGSLTFVDKAAAVVAFADMLADEGDGTPVNGVTLHAALKTRGFPISKTLLSYMRYTADYLMSAMPVALSDGLGWHSVARVRKLHRAARRYWAGRCVGSEDEFDNIFRELCRRSDGPDWQLEPLRQAVELEIAEAADVSLQSVRLSLHASEFTAMPALDAERDDQISGSLQRSGNPLGIKQPLKGRAGSTGAADTVTISVIEERSPVNQANDRTLTKNEARQCPFVELRKRAYGLAYSLGGRLGIGNLVLPLPDCGNGYLVADVPDPERLKAVDANTRASIGTMWWQLLAFSDAACAPPELIRDRLPASSSLRAILEGRELELLFDRVQIVDAAYLADRFWGALSTDDWQDWLYLAHTHRELRAKVIESEQPLWSRSP